MGLQIATVGERYYRKFCRFTLKTSDPAESLLTFALNFGLKIKLIDSG